MKHTYSLVLKKVWAPSSLYADMGVGVEQCLMACMNTFSLNIFLLKYLQDMLWLHMQMRSVHKW